MNKCVCLYQVVLQKKPAGGWAPPCGLWREDSSVCTAADSLIGFKLKPPNMPPHQDPCLILPHNHYPKKNFPSWKWPCWAEACSFKSSLRLRFEKSSWTLDWLCLEGSLNLVHLGAQKRRFRNPKASIASCLISLLTFFFSSPARLRWLKSFLSF